MRKVAVLETSGPYPHVTQRLCRHCICMHARTHSAKYMAAMSQSNQEICGATKAVSSKAFALGPCPWQIFGSRPEYSLAIESQRSRLQAHSSPAKKKTQLVIERKANGPTGYPSRGGLSCARPLGPFGPAWMYTAMIQRLLHLRSDPLVQDIRAAAPIDHVLAQ